MRHVSMIATMGFMMGVSAIGCAAQTDSSEESGTAVASELKAPAPFLALGDSIAFGYDPTVANPAVASNFVGYSDALATCTGTTDVNAACPGETSGSYLSATAPDNGCRGWRFGYGLPLHTAYAGTQASFAAAYVAAHPGLKYITYNMGANDLFLVQAGCAGNATCIAAALPAALATYGQNVATAFGGLKAAGFTGKVVALTTYATNYADPLAVPALTALNGVLTQVATQFGYPVADGFAAFKLASSRSSGDACAAGLLIKLPDGTCNIHPSVLGRTVLEAAVAATVIKNKLGS